MVFPAGYRFNTFRNFKLKSMKFIRGPLRNEQGVLGESPVYSGTEIPFSILYNDKNASEHHISILTGSSVKTR